MWDLNAGLPRPPSKILTTAPRWNDFDTVLVLEFKKKSHVIPFTGSNYDAQKRIVWFWSMGFTLSKCGYLCPLSTLRIFLSVMPHNHNCQGVEVIWSRGRERGDAPVRLSRNARWTQWLGLSLLSLSKTGRITTEFSHEVCPSPDPCSLLERQAQDWSRLAEGVPQLITAQAALPCRWMESLAGAPGGHLGVEVLEVPSQFPKGAWCPVQPARKLGWLVDFD